MMPEGWLVDGVASGALPVDDRGLAYGDGLFETMRARDGRIALWGFHLARLRCGCERLGIPEPDGATLVNECERVLDGDTDAVLKLILTRGSGGRGYAVPHEPRPRRVLTRMPAPPPPRPEGLRLHACVTRLPLDPALAGIKHLNRLHQVLARTEAEAAGADEGLCLDAAGRVACATAANVFAVVDGALRTPSVDQAGVAGACRAALLADPWLGPTLRVGALSPLELERASEVFLTSAVRGVQPVAAIGGSTFVPGPAIAAARAALARTGFVAGPA
ncbi:MAG: aminodeoxychorismate lyase [Pseudomonadota bacterium]|jgi:4-amino-4-deoxychorismate lyase